MDEDSYDTLAVRLRKRMATHKSNTNENIFQNTLTSPPHSIELEDKDTVTSELSSQRRLKNIVNRKSPIYRVHQDCHFTKARGTDIDNRAEEDLKNNRESSLEQKNYKLSSTPTIYDVGAPSNQYEDHISIVGNLKFSMEDDNTFKTTSNHYSTQPHSPMEDIFKMTAHGLPDHCIYTECSDEADEASDIDFDDPEDDSIRFINEMNEDYSSQAESTIPTDWSNQDSISSNDTHSILSPLPDKIMKIHPEQGVI